MAKIVKTKWNNINGGTDRTDIYPITSDRAVYNADNKTMRQVIRERGVVNISTYFTYDGTPEVLTLETALKKITEENRCPGFLATILTSEGWWTFRYSGYKVDDTTWYNTDNWVPFHAGWLKTDTTSEDPETPLHLEWIVKNYIYTLKGWIDSVSTERNGYFTAEDYKKFLQALEDIKNLQERMAAAEATIQNHEERLTSAEATIQNHEERLTSAESTIKDHESRISTAETEINNIQVRLNNDESRITVNENDIVGIKNDITSINGSINSIQTVIDTINSSIASINLEISALQDSISNLKIATVVSELPTENINTNTMYLVPDPNAEEGNRFIEWIYVNNEWEKVGEVKLDTDLSEYTKTKDLNNYIGTLGYAKTEDVVTSITVQNTSSSDIEDCLSVSPVYTTKGDVVINVGLASANLKNWIDVNVPAVPTNISAFNNDVGYITESALDGYAKTTDIPTIPTDVSAFTNDAGYITQSALNDYAKLSDIPDVPTNVSAFANDAGYITNSALDGYAKTADIPTVPTEVSAFINDVGYITQSALDGYATEEWVKGQGYLTEHQDLSNYCTIGYITDNYYDNSYINTTYYTKQEIQDLLNTLNPSTGESGVSSVQVSGQGDDNTGILNISPTTVQTGIVAVNIGIAEAKLKTWIENNISSPTGITEVIAQSQDSTGIFSMEASESSNTVTITGTIDTEALKTWLNNNGYGASSAGVTEIKATSLSDIITVQPTSYSDGQVELCVGVDEDKLKEWLDDNGYGSGEIVTGESLSSSSYYPSTTAKLITGTIDRSSVRINRPNGTASSMKGHEIHMIFKANMDTTVTISTTSSMVAADGVTSVSLSEGEYIEISIICDGTTFYTRTGVSNA